MPSITQIEHVPTADKRTLAAWGFSSADIHEHNFARGQCVLTMEGGTTSTDYPIWADGDKIIVWIDGVRRWHGWLVQPSGAADASAEAQRYTLYDPWYILEHIQISQPESIRVLSHKWVPYFSGLITRYFEAAESVEWTAPSGDKVTFVVAEDQSDSTVQGQICRAMYSAIWAGAPVAIGLINIDFPAPPQAPKNQTCAAWIQSAAANSPLCSGYWDYSGTVPALRAHPRSAATITTHALGAAVAAYDIGPLYDVQMKAIRITYRYMDPVEFVYTGDPDYTITQMMERTVVQAAGNDALPEGPGVLKVLIECANEEEVAIAMHNNIPAKMFAASGALAWGGGLDIDATSGALPAYRPGTALNLSGGNPEWATMMALIQSVRLRIDARGDACVLTLGAPDQLGIQDWQELARLTRGAGSADASTHAAPVPGTINDISDSASSYQPIGSIAYESRGGTCTVLGFNEFSPASSPPKKYSRANFSGTTGYTGFSGETDSITASGSDYYLGAVRQYGAKTTSASSGNVISSSPSTPFSTGRIAFIYSRMFSEVISQTVDTVRFNDTVSGTGLITQTLVDEDTDAVARDRMLATADWEAATSATIAQWTPRITGWVTAFQEIRLRPTIPSGGSVPAFTGCKAWWPYTLEVHTERAAINEDGVVVGTWAALPLVSRQSIANLDGVAEFGDWITLTPEHGYAIRISPTYGINCVAK